MVIVSNIVIAICMIQVKTNIQESLSQTIMIMWLVIAIIEDLDIYCDIYTVFNLYVVSCSTFINEFSDIREKKSSWV